MTEEMTPEFREAFNLHPIGSPDKTWGEVQYAVIMKKDEKGGPLTYEYIYTKWRSYIQLCKIQETAQKYIKHMDNFVAEGMYLGVYDYKDTRQENIVDRWLKGL